MPRILLVDDDVSFRKMLRLTLTHMGHVVYEVHDGNEALAAIEEAPVDLVLTDLIMPDKDGIETIGEIRRRYRNLKIIAMSGGGRVSAGDYLHIARAMGAHRVLAKPFSIDEMREAISAILPCDQDAACGAAGGGR